MTDKRFENCQQVQVDIKVGDSVQKFNVKQLSCDEAEELFTPLTEGTEQQKSAAKRGFRKKLIARCVTRADGSEFTLEQAGACSFVVAKQLEQAVMDVNGLGDTDGKNA